MQLRDLDDIIKKLKKSKVPLDTEIDVKVNYDKVKLEDIEFGDGYITLIPSNEPVADYDTYGE